MKTGTKKNAEKNEIKCETKYKVSIGEIQVKNANDRMNFIDKTLNSREKSQYVEIYFLLHFASKFYAR